MGSSAIRVRKRERMTTQLFLEGHGFYSFPLTSCSYGATQLVEVVEMRPVHEFSERSRTLKTASKAAVSSGQNRSTWL